VFREFQGEFTPDTVVTVGQANAQARPGRRKGQGSFERFDQRLFPMMQKLIDQGKAASPEAASHLVAKKAKGSGTLESKAERLAKRFRASKNIDRNKSD
jgi:hypothetical protein